MNNHNHNHNLEMFLILARIQPPFIDLSNFIHSNSTYLHFEVFPNFLLTEISNQQ